MVPETRLGATIAILYQRPRRLTDGGLNEAAAAAGAAGFGEGFLPERMWMLKPIPQTGVTDGPVEPSSAPDD